MSKTFDKAKCTLCTNSLFCGSTVYLFVFSLQDDRSGCFNFLSVYARFPSNNISQNTMLVCATNAGVVQDCVTVEVSLDYVILFLGIQIKSCS